MAVKKRTVKNKIFSTVKDKLEFMHKNSREPELFEDLKQLFIKKGFKNVSIEHGNKEYGKDLVFSITDPAFDEEKWYAAIVKNKDAGQNDFVDGGEIALQVQLATKIPYTDTKGNKHIVSGIFIIANGSVTNNAREIMQQFIPPVLIPNIKIWDYQKLGYEIETFIKELFLDKLEPVIHVFSKAQIKILSDLRTTNQLFNMKLEDIDDIFINVQTTYSKHIKKYNDYLGFDSGKSKKSVDDDIDGSKEILNSDKNFIIHGIPTCGKSLLLRRIGIKALQSKTGKPNAVFFFELPNLIGSIPNGQKADFDKLIVSQYSELTGGAKLELDDFEKVYLLFDSLDEIKSNDQKFSILKEIENFVAKKHSNPVQVIVTLRTTEILDNEKLLHDFEKTELLPFNIGQALKLVKKIIPDNKAKSNAFIGALKHSLLKSGLLRTPLALTLMAILYRDDKVDLKELPANITELYNKFIDTYLDRWDVTKGISRQYQYEQTKIILAFIAFHFHALGVNTILERDLIIYLKELRSEFDYEELNDVEKFVDHLKWKNGVFYYDDVKSTFAFYNHYFQEFFVSLCIDDTNEDKLKENFFSGWWENAVVFYCGKQPRRDVFLLDACKNIVPGDLTNQFIFLQLVSKCLQAGHSISINSRLIIIKRLLHDFHKFYLTYIEAGKTGISIASDQTTMDVIIQFRDLFERIFSSKHIATKETLEYFEGLLRDEKSELDEVTRYCIAYFLAFHTDKPDAFNILLENKGMGLIWNRVIYVDIDFLSFKRGISRDAYFRIRHKMLKQKFSIIEIMKGKSTEFLGKVGDENKKLLKSDNLKEKKS